VLNAAHSPSSNESKEEERYQRSRVCHSLRPLKALIGPPAVQQSPLSAYCFGERHNPQQVCLSWRNAVVIDQIQPGP